MSTLELESLLPDIGDLTAGMIERWIAAALAQAAALREHDGWLYSSDPARREISERLHVAWRHWADDADALLHHAEALALAERMTSSTNLEELRDALGRAHAMLRLTPQRIAERRDQVRRGEVFSIEEVRRELRLRDRR